MFKRIEAFVLSSSKMNQLSFAVFLQETVLWKKKCCFVFLVGLPAWASISTEALFLKTCFYSRITALAITAVSYNFGYEKSVCSVFISFNGPFSYLPFSSPGTVSGISLLCVFFSFVQHSEIKA